MHDIPYIKSVEAWQDLVREREAGRDLVVVKLSPACGLSHMAESTVDRWVAGLPSPPEIDVYKVDVLADRTVSNHLEAELGVRHESPQVLWLGDGGTVKWHASHRGISRERLEAQTQPVEEPEGEP